MRQLNEIDKSSTQYLFIWLTIARPRQVYTNLCQLNFNEVDAIPIRHLYDS